MKIVIGNDHAGVEFKNKIMQALRSKGHEIINREANFGILICGTGIGISIAANKITLDFIIIKEWIYENLQLKEKEL